MLKITLLKTLYHEINESIIPESDIIHGKDRRFHTMKRNYNCSPEILSITVEERYLPYSILYFIWINDNKKEADLNDVSLLRWILSFFREYRPEFLCKEVNSDDITTLDQLLECFNADAIPSHRDNRAYRDLEITTMEDVKNGIVKKDTRQATFPGMTFSRKYKKE